MLSDYCKTLKYQYQDQPWKSSNQWSHTVWTVSCFIVVAVWLNWHHLYQSSPLSFGIKLQVILILWRFAEGFRDSTATNVFIKLFYSGQQGSPSEMGTQTLKMLSSFVYFSWRGRSSRERENLNKSQKLYAKKSAGLRWGDLMDGWIKRGNDWVNELSNEWFGE